MDSHLVQVLLSRLEKLKQSCHNMFILSTWKKNTPCRQGGRRLLHHKLLGHQIFVSQEYMYIKKNTQFSIDQLMECQLQMLEVAQKLMKTLLFSFQDLKLSTKDIIAVLKDTLNTTSGPLPILDPYVTRVPSNTLERHSISSRIVNGVCNLITGFGMVKLVGFLTSDFTFTYQKELRIPHLWICYSAKALWIAILSTKSLTHFWRWCLVRELPSAPELPLSTELSQQSWWEDIHLEWYILIQVPNQWFLEFNLPRRWACSTPNYRNLCGKFVPLVRM